MLSSLFLGMLVAASVPPAATPPAAPPAPAPPAEVRALADALARVDGTAESAGQLVGGALAACAHGRHRAGFPATDTWCQDALLEHDMTAARETILAVYARTLTPDEMADSLAFLQSEPMVALRDGATALREDIERLAVAWEEAAARLVAAPPRQDTAPGASGLVAMPAPWAWPILRTAGLADRTALRARLMDRARARTRAPEGRWAAPDVQEALDRVVEMTEAATAARFSATGARIATALDSPEAARVRDRLARLRPGLEAAAREISASLDAFLAARAEKDRLAVATDPAPDPAPR